MPDLPFVCGWLYCGPATEIGVPEEEDALVSAVLLQGAYIEKGGVVVWDELLYERVSECPNRDIYDPRG